MTSIALDFCHDKLKKKKKDPMASQSEHREDDRLRLTRARRKDGSLTKWTREAGRDGLVQPGGCGLDKKLVRAAMGMVREW